MGDTQPLSLAAVCGCGIVDIHTHIVPENFPPYLGSRADAAWPSMKPAHACHRHVMVSGKLYRTVSNQCWNTELRQSEMDNMQVQAQVLSPMPELLSYWLSPEDGASLCRFLNETIAEMARFNPARFYGLGAVPLQDVHLAIRVLDEAVHQMGLAGVEIAGNINGVAVGDPKFHPFFEAAAEWGASIFIHPLRALGADRLVGPPMLEQAVAFPGEIGMAGASLITSNLLYRLPGLRIALSHGGGSLPVLVARMQQAWQNFPALPEVVAGEPAQIARQLYVDNLLYDRELTAQLLRTFGETQVMAGTDYPFAIMESDPAGRLMEGGFDARVLKLLVSENALRWLGR